MAPKTNLNGIFCQFSNPGAQITTTIQRTITISHFDSVVFTEIVPDTGVE